MASNCMVRVSVISTATWPGTDRWRACLGGPAPAHWWPRSHWHLCWLVYRPDPDHRAALDAALAEGEADRELGLLARSLRAVILH